MMSDYISRQDAINALCNDYCGGHQDCKYYPKCENLKSIEQLPSVQPETAEFIRWMEYKKTENYISYTPHCKCSECGNELLIDNIKYCYMCGARMETENEQDNRIST